MDSKDVVRFSTQAKDVISKFQSSFNSLSTQQLNWKPNAKTWSIGEVISHIVETNKCYFLIFEKALNKDYKPSFWQSISPFTGMFGNIIAKAVDPKNHKKTGTFKVFYPLSSAFDISILQDLEETQNKIADYIKQTDSLNHSKITLASPASSVVTYKLDKVIEIVSNHSARHYLQAKNLMDLEGFPKQ